jgi:ABC-type phosphate transport system permease subunit
MYAAAITTDQLISKILENIINPFITLLVGVAIIYFLWGAFQFVRNAESSDERKKGGMNMLWGVLGLFIMSTAYGILNLVLATIKQ